MTDMLKKLFFAGVGLTQTIREKTDKEIEELAERGEKSNDRVSNFAKELFGKIDKEYQDIKDKVDNLTNKDRNRDEKINQLTQEIQELKSQIEKLKQSQG